jgi:FlaG/FlaF family flagellin (archaellin)
VKGMALKNNPFYILNASCNAGRREIVSAADEMSFMLDSETSSRAQNELINLNKRLSAEINWFIDVDKDTLDSIRQSIESDEPISTDGLSGLSKLNAILFNFYLSDNIDSYELGYSLLEIDEQYSALDTEEITERINHNRNEAKLGLVQVQDVAAELGKKREEIRQLITDKLSNLDQDTYVELITMLAEKCIAGDEYDDGVVLSDVIDQYEVRMQSVLEESTEKIENHIERIKSLVNDSAVTDNINALIRRVEKWDALAQPLQLKSQASGMPHEISEHLGSELRNLALYLHNEKGLTNEALTLVNAMKSVFAELGVLSDLFENDSDALNDLLKGQKEDEEIITELKSLQNESESIKTIPSLTKINSFVDRVKKLDQRIKTVDLDSETKIAVRENLCLMARGTAIELHNTKHQTSFALTIARALVDEFGDLTSLRAKLFEDVTTLNQQLQLSLRQPTATRSYSSPASTGKKSNNPGCLVGIIVAVIIFIIIAVSSGGGGSSKTSPSTSSNNSNSTQAQSESKFTSSSAAGSKVYADIVSIFPEMGIYSQGSSTYTHFVCRCKTSSGGTVWVYMTTTEYKNNFDSSASTSVYNQYADEVTFSTKRIHGVAKKAETIMSGLAAETSTMIIVFSSVK